MHTCRGCKNKMSDEILLQFQNMPKSAQHFPDASNVAEEKGVDIILRQCPYCGLIQVSGSPVSYFRDVIRATGVSEEMRLFRERQYKEWVDKYHLKGKKMIEIGAGTGEYMNYMENTGAVVTGLEHLHASILTGQACGHKMMEGFVEDDTFQIEDAPYDGFYSMNFLEHIPDPAAFLRGIASNLTDEAVGLIEVPNFNMILQKKLYSEFIQDHLSYFTKATLCNLLEQNGFEVISCEEIWYDYIISAIVRKRRPITVKGLLQAREDLYEQVKSYLKEKESEKKTVAVWGAGHQALANLSLLDMKDKVSYVLDSAEFKQHHYTPATHIPIVSPEVLKNGEIQAVIIMGAGYSDEIHHIMEQTYPEIEHVILRENGIERGENK